VKSIKQGALAPGLFAAPAGYTQRKPFEGAGHGMPGHPPAGKGPAPGPAPAATPGAPKP
jgi:hypothetical protein